MKRHAFMIVLGLVMTAAPAMASTLDQLYSDAAEQADAGKTLLESADWQFRDGNVQQGCSIMEQARIHYEQAYKDLQAMDEMVNDTANGYSDDDRQKVMDWIGQQKEIADPIAARMAETYFASCQ